MALAEVAGGSADDDGPRTRTAERALRVLSAVALATDRPTLGAVAAEAGLPLSTTSRLLRTLEREAFVGRAADGRYWPGSRLLQVGARAIGGLPVAVLAGPHLEALAAATGETAYLLVPGEPGQGVYVGQLQSESSIRHAEWLGRAIPLEGTAAGAALAGDLADGGYALNRGAVEPDTATAAAPVVDVLGRRVAVLSVIAPAYRVDEAELHRIGRLVAAAATELSSQLGGVPAEG